MRVGFFFIYLIMDNQERFENIISNLPESYECKIDGDTMLVKGEGKQVKVVFTGKSYVVGGRTLHFKQDTEEVFTWLVPMILTAIDGEERI